MRIVVVSIVAPPDAVSTAQLVGEAASDLALLGHDVTILSTEPHYNEDVEAAKTQPIVWRSRRLVGTSSIGPVSVEHARMSAKSQSKVGRLAQWCWFHCIVIARLRHLRPDAVLTVSPPPTLSLAVRIATIGRQCRSVLAVWELYPDILISLGLVKAGSAQLWVLRVIERMTYRSVHHVAFLTSGMRERAVENGCQAEKSSVVPTWADTELFRPIERPTNLSRELGFENKFVVGYGGNLGPAQDLSSLIRAAARLEVSHPNIQFLLCGDGSEAEQLQQQAKDLRNVHFTGQLPVQRSTEMYSTFDVSVVALAREVGNEALPSKVYRSLACGVPLLAIADHSAPLTKLVRDSHSGAHCPPGNPAELAKTISAMAEDPLHQVQGQAGRRVAQERFSRRTITQQLEHLLSGPT